MHDSVVPAGAAEDPAEMAVHCGWCKAVLRPGREPASHGVCPACLREYLLPPAGDAPPSPTLRAGC